MQPAEKKARVSVPAAAAEVCLLIDMLPAVAHLLIASFLDLTDAHALRKSTRRFPQTAPSLETFVINDAAFGCIPPSIDYDEDYRTYGARSDKRKAGADEKERTAIQAIIDNWSKTIVKRRSVRRLRIEGSYALCTPELWTAVLALFAGSPILQEVEIVMEVITGAAWKHFGHMIRGAVRAFLHVDTLRFTRPEDNPYGTDKVVYKSGEAPEAVFCDTLVELAAQGLKPRWRRLELDRNLYRYAITGDDDNFVKCLPSDTLEALDWHAALPDDHKLHKLHEYAGNISDVRYEPDFRWVTPWKSIQRNSGKWTKLHLRRIANSSDRHERKTVATPAQEILEHVAGPQLKHLDVGSHDIELTIAEMKAIVDKSPNLEELGSLPAPLLSAGGDEKKSDELSAVYQGEFMKMIAESKCAPKLRSLTTPFNVSQAPEQFTIELYKACTSLQMYPPWQHWVLIGKEVSQSSAVARVLADPSRRGTLKRLALFASDEWTSEDVIAVMANSPKLEDLCIEKPLATREIIVWIGANLRHLTNLKIRATTDTVITDEMRQAIAKNNPGLAEKYTSTSGRYLYAVSPPMTDEERQARRPAGMCVAVQAVVDKT